MIDRIESLPVFEGDYPYLERKLTGLWSFDRALGNPETKEWGLPLRSIIQLYGHKHIGKSTLSYYLAGCVDPKGVITLVDIEGFDRKYIIQAASSSGFAGTIRQVADRGDKGKPRFHAQMIQDLALSIDEDEVSATVFDSVSAYQSQSEKEGKIGEANMGKRAKEVAQFSRLTAGALRYADKPKVALVVNHAYQIVGGRGHTTAGGEVLSNLSAAMIYMWRMQDGKLSDDRDDFIAKGVVEKLRFGGKGRKFRVAYIAGRGVHKGLTAMFDCIALELAERGTTVKLNGESQGRIGTLIKAAQEGDNKAFVPFEKALAAYKG